MSRVSAGHARCRPPACPHGSQALPGFPYKKTLPRKPPTHLELHGVGDHARGHNGLAGHNHRLAEDGGACRGRERAGAGGGGYTHAWDGRGPPWNLHTAHAATAVERRRCLHSPKGLARCSWSAAMGFLPVI